MSTDESMEVIARIPEGEPTDADVPVSPAKLNGSYDNLHTQCREFYDNGLIKGFVQRRILTEYPYLVKNKDWRKPWGSYPNVDVDVDKKGISE